MTMGTRTRALMLGTVLGAALIPASAFAQDAAQLQRQMDALQQQMQSLQKQVAESKKRQAAEAYATAPVANRPYTKAPIVLADHVKLTWGGFLAAEAVYRAHNTTSDIGTPFSSIPYPFAPTYGESEFRGTARQSRLSLLAEGQIDPIQKLAGYYEMDFLNVGVTSNYNQSNSWAPRARQLYMTYDNTAWGFHFLGGQAWSLATGNTVGITPRKENIPLTIDANYVVGFDYTRNWQLRMVKDFGPAFSLGVSVEAPAQQVYTGTGAIANNGSLNGVIVNFTNAGSTFLGSGAFANNFTTDTAPDIIVKAAFDPGWGHYEVYGLQRFFSDGVFACPTADVGSNGVCATTGAPSLLGGSTSNKTTYGDGIGGSVLLPIIATYLDFTANGLYGRGVGRYGASQLPDVFVGPDGSLTPITEYSVMVGLIAHPWAGLDVYAYAGQEAAQGNFFTSRAGGYTGFGIPTAVNTGCYTTTAASFTGGTNNCNAINKQISDVTVGFWQNLYKGDFGRVATGLQWEYIKRESFNGVGGMVSTNDNVILGSIRYYPF